MNILAAAIKIDQILPPITQFIINHGVQRGRIRSYPQAYSREIQNLPVKPLLIHRLLEGGIVILCPVHNKKCFRKGQHFLLKKQPQVADKRG